MRPAVSRAWEHSYRDKWRWERSAWGSHCVDCYPGNCTFRVYVRDGKVLREEQAGTFPVVEAGVPDMNPMGCRNGASWSTQLYAAERLLHPLKRKGPRGGGTWERISWDQALTEIADAIIDAVGEVGPGAILGDGSPEPIASLGRRLIALLGGTVIDPVGEVSDFSAGVYLTFGKFFTSSVDDWFHSDLILIWHRNPAYTQIPWFHFVTEARYRGAEVVTIAPDYNASAIHADTFVPVEAGTDAALALALCAVVIEEGLWDAAFVKEQTDLALLVRKDNRRFLRASDLNESGSDQQFYLLDSRTGRLAEAPRATLSLDDVDPTLRGSFRVTLRDGKIVEVVPAMELLAERLRDYIPEKVSKTCGVHPEVIRTLARAVAKKRTNILLGWNAAKYYHGDLMERSMSLLLGLTGNWGKRGTGIRSWVVAPAEGLMVPQAMIAGLEDADALLAMQRDALDAVSAMDPSLSREMAAIEMMNSAAAIGGMIPPVFFWYHHCGFRALWNRREWQDPSMHRAFDDYFREAVEKGWWPAAELVSEDTRPRVLIVAGGNTLRRVRQGQTTLLEHLWPQLQMIVSVDYRMNTTGLFSDIILPAANHYEKVDHHITTPEIGHLTLSDRAVDAPVDVKEEWELFALLAERLEERAKERGVGEFQDRQGINRRLDNLYAAFTLNGRLAQKEQVVAATLETYRRAGLVPEESDMDRLRQQGFIRFTGWGETAGGLAQAADVEPGKTHAPLLWHVEKKLPYPTLTRRAQFYIDHDWFLEAGEELPCHKDNPSMGGDHPLILTSGHSRWSIHAMNIAEREMLRTHRGKPFAFIHPRDAAARGIEDGDAVRLFNDLGSSTLAAKIASGVRPGQVIVYNGFEAFMFPGWKNTAQLVPGMTKWLHLAGGYGHLRYRPLMWQPQQADRAVRVNMERVRGDADSR